MQAQEVKRGTLEEPHSAVWNCLPGEVLQQCYEAAVISQNTPLANVFDAVLVKRKVEALGYVIKILANPFHYRGDTRTPDVIFKEGFCRKKDVSVSIQHGQSYGCVAATRNLITAVGFADCPLHTQ